MYKSPKTNIIKSYIRKKRIFFEETNLNTLPENNFDQPKNFPGLIEDEIAKLKYNRTNTIPYTYNYLVPLIKKLNKKEIDFLDVGAGTLKNYFLLTNNFQDLNYFYYDVPEKKRIIENNVRKENFKKIFVCNHDDIKNNKFDIVFLGSCIQYISNYESFINILLERKPSFILFTAMPSFNSNYDNRNFFVIKQLNLYPSINYLYQFNINEFKKLFLKRNYKEVFIKENTSDSSINFKNFKNKNIHSKYIDIMFKK